MIDSTIQVPEKFSAFKLKYTRIWINSNDSESFYDFMAICLKATFMKADISQFISGHSECLWNASTVLLLGIS